MFDTSPQLDCAGRILRLDRARVMGIVNVTPDSFSDGGAHDTTEAAVAHGLKLVEEGADLLDIGGESTRPGAAPVSVEEELRRVIPVIEQLAARTRVPISIDTFKPEVMRAAVAAGAGMINDIFALRQGGALEAAPARAQPASDGRQHGSFYQQPLFRPQCHRSTTHLHCRGVARSFSRNQQPVN